MNEQCLSELLASALEASDKQDWTEWNARCESIIPGSSTLLAMSRELQETYRQRIDAAVLDALRSALDA